MDPLLETIDLDIEESNELAFKIKVEGTANSPAKVRLVCEGSDVSYMFNGRGTGEDGVVQFIMPQMKDKLPEGVYQAKVEVLIENRYFSPVQFQINFKKAVKVVAEALFLQPKIAKPEISVSAQPIIVSKPVQKAQPQVVQPKIVVEQSKQEQPQSVDQVAKKATIAENKPTQQVSSLKEKYAQKVTGTPRNVTESLEMDDEVLSELARAFLNRKKR